MAYTIKDKLQFLSEASKILSSSLDYNITLTSIANLIVKNIADFCAIDLLSDNGELRCVVTRASNYVNKKLVYEMFRFSPDPKNKNATYDVVKSRKSILIDRVTEEWLRSSSRFLKERALIKKLKISSFMFVPLKSRGKIIGVLTIASSDKNFSYNKNDVLLAEELGVQAGIAVDKARLYMETQEALQARDEFLSIASHELRTPVTSILLHVQAVLNNMRNDVQTKDNKRMVKMLETTEQQTRRLAKLINDLLNVSLVTTGRLDLEKEEADLAVIVKDALTRFEVQLKKAKIPVKLQVKKSIGYWDKVRLEQVISNLISNAIKYGRGKQISITVKKVGNEAVCSIEDKGIGIKPQYQKIIFERFKRGVLNKDYRGLGVGLYIANQIVHLHGGIISIKSKINRGSTFTIRLPINQ